MNAPDIRRDRDEVRPRDRRESDSEGQHDFSDDLLDDDGGISGVPMVPNQHDMEGAEFATDTAHNYHDPDDPA